MAKSKSAKSKPNHDWILVIVGAIFIFVIAISLSLVNVTASTKQTTHPGIDDDSGWVVQNIEKGEPLTLISTKVVNHGFWSGYKTHEKSEIHWNNVAVYAFASFITSLAVVQLTKPLRTQ